MQHDGADQTRFEKGDGGVSTTGTRDESDHPRVLHLVGEFGHSQLA